MHNRRMADSAYKRVAIHSIAGEPGKVTAEVTFPPPTITIWPRDRFRVDGLAGVKTRAIGRVDWAVYECSARDQTRYNAYWGEL